LHPPRAVAGEPRTYAARLYARPRFAAMSAHSADSFLTAAVDSSIAALARVRPYAAVGERPTSVAPELARHPETAAAPTVALSVTAVVTRSPVALVPRGLPASQEFAPGRPASNAAVLRSEPAAASLVTVAAES